jgi:hypothetical protein
MLGTWKTRFVVGLAVAALAAVAALTAAAQSSAQIYCTGALPPGFYGDTVEVPPGADCEGVGGVIISGGVVVDAGATFVLGSEDSPGPLSFISGAFRATNAANVQLHFMTLRGGLFILGGSGPFGGPFGVTWNTIEDSKIIGDTIILGYDGFWQGFIRNHTLGNVNLVNNVVADPDGNEVVSNSIHGILNCSGNDPAPQVGDSGGSPNLVYGPRIGGQCVGL